MLTFEIARVRPPVGTLSEDLSVLQFKTSCQSANTENVVFGVVRNPAGASELKKLEAERENVHVLQADVTDYDSLKVRIYRQRLKFFCGLQLFSGRR